MRRISYIVAGIVLLAIIAGGAFMVLRPTYSDKFAQCRAAGKVGGKASIGGPFSLINGDGKSVTDVDVIDRPTLVYFGYTFCPDVCPQDNYRNAQAVEMLDKRGFNVKQVFITIDPERDTPEALKAFTGYMSDKMVGLTGSPENIAAAIKEYRVYARKNGTGDDYLMDHSTSTYLMAPGYGMLDFFRRDLTPTELADQVQCFVEKL